MEKIVSAIEELLQINNAYELPTEELLALSNKTREAKVCTPIIGKFSSGKSALVNTLLGYRRRILREDITPETAVPAELVYNEEDEVTLIGNDGSTQQLSVEEYRSYEADAATIKCARIQLRNSFLSEIPDVMLVDMPGFESGFEIHNRAIDDYLPQSLAYIIAFPADDLIVRSSVGSILKELCLHDMPLCIVITKWDKKGPDVEETLAKMKQSLKRYIGERQVRYCRTTSQGKDVEELEEFLREIQAQSRQILANSFRTAVLAEAQNTENYLKTTLANSRLSESELQEQEGKLEKQLDELGTQFSKEQDSFEQEVSACTEQIKNDVQCALEAEQDTLTEMAMNQQNINGRLNQIVRNAVTVSVKKRFMPLVEKYLRRVAKCINSETLGDLQIQVHLDVENLEKGNLSTIVAVATGVLMGMPILGILTGIFMKLQSNKKREEARQRVSQRLQQEIFPQVLQEVGKSIKMTISEQVQQMNTSIEQELTSQKALLEKAMADVRGRIDEEKSKKENLEAEIKADLERIGEIKDGL